MTIGEIIRNTREDLDITQKQMAEQIPMNQSNYSKIERDIQEPSLEQLRRICLILKLDPRLLLNLPPYENLPILEKIQGTDLALLKDVKALIQKYGNK